MTYWREDRRDNQLCRAQRDDQIFLEGERQSIVLGGREMIDCAWRERAREKSLLERGVGCLALGMIECNRKGEKTFKNTPKLTCLPYTSQLSHELTHPPHSNEA